GDAEAGGPGSCGGAHAQYVERRRADSTSGSPEGAGAVVGVTTLLAGVEVVHGGGHSDGHAQRQVVADVLDVVNRAALHPDELVSGGLDHHSAGELPLQAARQDDPPLIEVLVPVRPISV